MSMWRKTLVYLGLVEEPEEYDEMPERFAGAPPAEPDPAAPLPDDPGDEGGIRPLPSVAEPGGAHVRPMAAGLGARVQVVAVSTFDEGAAEIGRQYRMGVPVVFDMADAPPDAARRILDFVSGVTFALRGRMVKVGGRAFLVVPEGVELPASERERLAALGYGGGT